MVIEVEISSANARLFAENPTQVDDLWPQNRNNRGP